VHLGRIFVLYYVLRIGLLVLRCLVFNFYVEHHIDRVLQIGRPYRASDAAHAMLARVQLKLPIKVRRHQELIAF